MLARATAPPADAGDSLAAAVRAACRALGARVSDCQLPSPGTPDLDEAAMDEAVDRALSELGGIDLLVLDGAGLFACAAGRATGGGHGPARGRPDAREALGACLETSWNVTRAIASRAFLPRGQGGRIIYLAPPAAAVAAVAAPGAAAAPGPAAAAGPVMAPDPGVYADAARAGLENLGRTLSIEWARHGITALTIAPGTATSSGEVAALTAYLASPAGAYFSGCLLDLRGPAGRP